MKFLARLVKNQKDIDRRARDMERVEKVLRLSVKVHEAADAAIREREQRRMAALPRGDYWQPPYDAD